MAAPAFASSLRGRIWMAVISLGLLLACLGIASQAVTEATERLRAQAALADRDAVETLLAVERLRLDAFRYLGTAKPESMTPIRNRIEEGLSHLAGQAGPLDLDKDLVTALEASYRDVVELHWDFRTKRATEVMYGPAQEAHARLVRVLDQVRRERSAAAAESVVAARNAGDMALFGSLLAAVVVVMLVALVLRRMLAGVQSTVAVLAAASRGDLDAPIAAGGSDELEQIAAGIEGLRSALRTTLATVHVVAGRDPAGGGALAELVADARALRAEVERTFAELRASEERFRSVAANLPGVVYRCRADQGFTGIYVSDAIIDLTGWTADEVIGAGGHPLADSIHPDDRQRAHASLVAALAAGTTFERVYRLVHRDGSVRWVQERGRSGARAADGTALVDSAIFDITARRQLEQRLAQDQKLDALGQLVGGVAHDFNNALAGIMGMAELARRKVGDGHPAARHLDHVLVTSERAAALTRRLLAFARRSPVRRDPVDLTAVVAETIALAERTIDRRIRIELAGTASHQRGVAMVTGDAALLQSVVLNLLINARDAIAESGRIGVAIDVVEIAGGDVPDASPAIGPGRYVAVAVSDDGVGIDAEVRKHLFEPFFTTKAPGKGTGLGLSVVYGIVTDHHGAISVASRPGQGTTFRILLPVVQAAPAVRPDAPAAPATAPAGGRILVVDDEPDIREHLAEHLASLGWQVAIACDGREAVAAVAASLGPQAGLHAVVMDVSMPGLDGVGALRKIRRIAADLPVVMMSGFLPDGNVAALTADGATMFLAKPLRPSEVAAAVMRVARVATVAETAGAPPGPERSAPATDRT